MSHWAAVPFLLPAATAAVLLLLSGHLRWQRVVSVLSSLTLGALTAALAWRVSAAPAEVYAFGDWPARIGIVLVLDRLSAMMICLTAAVAVPSILYATRGWDARGRHFHALFHFQWMGLNGAFLTGDLFNLFVCFELMLIASYALLVHGAGAARLKAGLHYVVLNLIGSAMFLVAASVLYRVGGTLNMADLAVALTNAPVGDAPWIRTGAWILVAVFLLKGAVVPLHLWLPATYGAASPPVAAIFCVLTKVGAYAILRVGGTVFGWSPAMAGLEAVVLPLALITLGLAAIGGLAANSLSTLVAWLALASSASVLVGVGTFSVSGAAGGVFYAVPSTLALAGLFLLADHVGDARGPQFRDMLCRAPRMRGSTSLSVWFFVLAISVAGLPPLAAFLGKAMILSALRQSPGLWLVVLGASLLTVVALARAGSRLFWATDEGAAEEDAGAAQGWALAPVALLALAILVVTAGAGSLDRFARAAAADALVPASYLQAVLGPANLRWRVEIDAVPPAGTVDPGAGRTPVGGGRP
ncbi:MAG: monovalent cation/H+ antiporter subunit D [Betaproteobacteria bacterium]